MCPAGHQIEEVGGFVFRSKRRAAHASPGRAKRLCSPEQGTGAAHPAVSTGQPFTSIAINEQQPAAAKPAAPAAVPEGPFLQQASHKPHAELLNAPELLSEAGCMQHPGSASAMSHGNTEAASLGTLPLGAKAEAGPGELSIQPGDSLKPAAQLDATAVPGMASDSKACMHCSAEAQHAAADYEHFRQDDLQPALAGPTTDAASLQQQFTAEVIGTDGMASPGASYQQQQTDAATAGEIAASRGSIIELRPLLERMAAVCDAVRAQHGPDFAAEDGLQADAEGVALATAPEAISKVHIPVFEPQHKTAV